MNILFYCSEYPPFPTGGIGSVTKIVAESLAKRGHNISIVGYYEKMYNLPYYSEINGVDIYRLHKFSWSNKIVSFLLNILCRLRLSKFIVQRKLNYTESFIENIVRKKKIDVLEIPDYYSFNDKAENLAYKKFSVPVVLRIHGCCSFLQKLKGMNDYHTKMNDQHHFERCDYISAVSKYSMNYIKKNFVAPFLKEIVIYNPIEDGFINQSHSSHSSHVILFIGKLIETKGCYSLLNAFNACASKNPKWELHLIGRGDVKEAMSYIYPQYMNRVKFLGFCDRNTIQREIDECAFACIPSYFENCSMAALEIMARSRALIFTERTSGKEMIEDGIDGFVVDPKNVNEIADKMNILISNMVLRRNMEEKAYLKICNNFSVSKILSEMELFYMQMLKIEK